MKIEMALNAGVGDFLIPRILLDNIKNNHDIYVSYNRKIVEEFKNDDPAYHSFLQQLGELVFNRPPFRFTAETYPWVGPIQLLDIYKKYPNVPLIRPNLEYYCQGTPLPITEEYLVLTTKIRILPKNHLLPLLTRLWRTLNSSKYKIVILGEREIEQSKEYSIPGLSNVIYGIYDQAKANLAADKVIDLTIPALGITVPSLEHIRQDMLIMKNAKATITFGCGGNFWMAVSVSNTIGYRRDNEYPTTQINDLICHPNFHRDNLITNDWSKFIEKLRLL